MPTNFPTTWGSTATGLTHVFVTMGWGEIALIAVLISFFFAVILYMIGRGFQFDNVKRWAVIELYHALASLALVITLIIIVTFLIGDPSNPGAIQTGILRPVIHLAQEKTPFTISENADPYTIAYLYLESFNECLRTIYRYCFWVTMALKPIETTTYQVAGMEAVGGYFVNPMIQAAQWTANGVVFLILANDFQIYALQFFEYTMFTVFLPVGIVLRGLPVTRGAGGVLIAISIGFFIVYPLSFALLFLTVGDKPACISDVNVPQICAGPGTFAMRNLYFKRNIDKMHTDIWKMHDLYISYMKQVFFFPLVCAIIALSWIRATAAYFGSDITEIGDGLIKLI